MPGRRLEAAVAGSALLLATAACGYALAGRGATLPAHIKVIAVPQFVNHTQLAGLEQSVTEAVRAELQSRGRFRVVLDDTLPDVDAVVRGTLTSVDRLPTDFNTAGQATRNNVVLVASIEFYDLREKKTLWSDTRASEREDVAVASSAETGDSGAFFRQNQSAVERLVGKFAKKVVTSMLEAF